MPGMNKVFLAFVGLSALSTASFAQSISVTVNDQPLSFAKQTPVQAPDGTILVPLREIFERLGATVQFLPGTRTIAAVRGATSVTLQLGESVGYVNGKPKSLATPAQSIGGATLVPLRFISEAFGATVKWNPTSRVVRIGLPGATPVVSTGVGGVKPPVERPIVIPVKGLTPDEIKNGGTPLPVVNPVVLPKTEPLAGTLTLIDTTKGELTVQPEGAIAESIALAPDAIILVKVGAAPQTRQELAALKIGDFLQIKRDSRGQAAVIETAYEERLGILKSADSLASGKSWILSFTEGPAVEVDTNATLTQQGSAITFNDLKPGDRVSVRLSPTTKRGNTLELLKADAPLPGKVEITKITHNAGNKWIKGGDTITFTVLGTPAAKGTLRIPGLVGGEALPLIETSPGTYLANITVPSGIALKDGTALATLTLDTVSSPTIASTETFIIDAIGPALATLTPPENADLTDARPNFTGQYSDQGSGIDARKSQLFINEEDVTSRAILTDSFFTYQPQTDLSQGKVTAKLIIRDTAGNATSREWSFTLVPVALLKTVTAAPVNQPLNFGDVLTVKAEGAPGAKATFSIGPTLKDLPMNDDGKGVYVGTYTIKKQDALVAAPVSVTLTDPKGRTATMTAPGTVTFTAGAPETPIIDLPQDGSRVGESVVLAGRTLPNASVKVVVRYSGKRAGLLAASGLVGEYTAKADARGRWATESIALKVPKEISGLVFTAEVTAEGTSGSGSATATVKFKK